MTSRRHTIDRDDRGAAALLLVIGVMIMVGFISAGLLTLVASSVNQRAPLDQARNRQYAADAAIESAVAQTRLMSTPGSGACAPAPGYYVSNVNGVAIRVDCRNNPASALNPNGFFYAQFNVVFVACLDTNTACTDSTAIIRAQVNFEKADFQPTTTTPVTKTYIQAWTVY
jgi:hypothetical protein